MLVDDYGHVDEAATDLSEPSITLTILDAVGANPDAAAGWEGPLRSALPSRTAV